MIPLEGPFVLLDDARADGASPARLYTNPVATLTAKNGDELEALLVALRQAQQDGLYVAGFSTMALARISCRICHRWQLNCRLGSACLQVSRR